MAQLKTTHQTAKTKFVKAANGVTYAYRTFGSTDTTQIPLLFLIHFRGTMDWWDPLLINSIAATRPVILFDNAGVGSSTGTVPDTLPAMAAHVIDFLNAINVSQADLIGFSMGGMIAQLVTLNGAPGLIRRLVIAGSGTSIGEGIIVFNPEQRAEVSRLAGQPDPKYDDGFDKLFFYPSPTSQAIGRAWWSRIHERNITTSGEERTNLVSTNYADGGAGVKAMSAAMAKNLDPNFRADHMYDRLGQISIPTLILQGKDDFMIPTVNSFVMQQKIPNARLKFWPDSGHGFLYQFAEEVAGDTNRFLDAN